jgi:tetratricopeptide (TPR) repeat protein
MIQNPYIIDKDGSIYISNILKNFPYFQTAHILYSKALQNTKSIRFKSQLKKAAIYSGDRNLLFDIISQQEDLNISKDTIKDKLIKEEKKAELHSFLDWISIVQTKKIVRSKKQNSDEIINIFLEKKPKIKKNKQRFFNASENAKKSIVENNDIITETLAKVYTKQEHFEKAILAYQKLSLKYPQKSSYFADQIKVIKKIKK